MKRGAPRAVPRKNSHGFNLVFLWITGSFEDHDQEQEERVTF